MMNLIRNTWFFKFLICGLFLTLFGFATTVSAEPYRLLGDNGAYFWSSSSIRNRDLFSLEDGKVMYIWSSRIPENGNKLLFLQIINSDGVPEYEEPLNVSDRNLFSSCCTAISDSEGNIYFSWLSARPDNYETAELFVHKFSSEGECLWDQYGNFIAEIRVDINGQYSDSDIDLRLLPDEHGGFYVNYEENYFAVGQGGELREEWRWHNEAPDEEPAMTSIESDGIGGFWYMGRTDWGEPYLINHLNYNGEKLWDEPLSMGEDEYPIGTRNTSFLKGINGGILFHCEHLNDEGIFLLDADGNFPGDEYSHIIRGEEDEIRISIYYDAIWCRDELIAISYVHGEINEGSSIYVTFYNPEENSFPVGLEGVLLYRHPADDDGRLMLLNRSNSDMIETNDGGIVLSYSGCFSGDYVRQYFLRLEPDNELAFDEPLVIKRPVYISPAQNDEFWITGGDYGYDLNRFTNDGQPVFAEAIDMGINGRGTLGSGIEVIVDNCNNYRILFRERDRLTLRTLDPNGNIVGDIEGQTIIPDGVRSANVFTYRDNFLVYWSSNTNPELSLVTKTGQLRWTVDLADSSNLITRLSDLKITPDGRYAVLSLYRTEEDFPYNSITVEPLITLVDINEREVQWTNELPQFDDEYWNFQYTNEIHVDSLHIYSVFWIYDDSISIGKYNYEGRMLLDEPVLITLEESDRFFGSALLNSENLGLARYHEQWQELRYVTMDVFNTDDFSQDTVFCVYTDSLRCQGLYPRTPFNLVSSGDRLWFTPETRCGFGIGCISKEGERFIDSLGFYPDVEPNLWNFWITGYPDGSGGLWADWSQGEENPYEDYIIHLDRDGRLYEGWEQSGLKVYEDNRKGRILNTTVFNDSSIVLVTSENNVYRLQHLSEHPQRSIDIGSAASVVDFYISNIYPNPFNSRININYYLNGYSDIEYYIYDLTGREIYSKSQTNIKAGMHRISINGVNWSSGIYFARFVCGNKVEVAKFTLIK
ncbi:MAG: T9SS type A sorting domain-containing protein [Candidatus Hatepunaea meridiana]|nr:T9SS type A sorting domain-containing protein [Candidatus Hatepunaea meridiana]